MANVILLWSDSLLRIKLSKLESFLKNCLKEFWDIFYDNYYYFIFFFFFFFFFFYNFFFLIFFFFFFFFFFQVAGLIVSYLAVIMSMPK